MPPEDRSFLSRTGELGFLEWIAGLHPDLSDGVLLGIGDDAAALEFTMGATILAAADSIVEGIHFRTEYFSPGQIGRKAVAVNLSDIAAMGASGRFILLQLGLPPETSREFIESCIRGLVSFASSNGLALVGGDISATSGPMFLAVTILGEAEPGKILRRSGAEEGDLIMVSGFPGEAAAGLMVLERKDYPPKTELEHVVRRHLEPEPKTGLSRLAAGSGAVNAAIDISDGLSTDLCHLCRAGGIGAVVEAGAVPISDNLDAAAVFLGIDPLVPALNGGEGYELLMAVRPAGAGKLIAAAERSGEMLTVIGRFSGKDEGASIVFPDGARPLRPGGFDHFA